MLMLAMNSSAVLQTLGRAHVVVVHFPIALLIVAGLIEIVRAIGRKKEVSSASLICLSMGAISAGVAVLFGFFHKNFSPFEREQATTLAWHQWIGIAALVVAVVALLSRKRLGVFRVATLVGAILVGITGHFGGTLTHGEGYLTELLYPNENTVTEKTVPTKRVEAVDFVRDVQPILSKSCYECHGAEKHKGGLRLDNKIAAMKGGNGGPAIITGDSKKSLLIQRVLGVGKEKRMPIDHPPLSDSQIGALMAWVDHGANWPDGAGGVVEKEQAHWAYVKPVAPRLPDVKDSSWSRNEIDRFVLARLEKEGMKPSVEADRATLIRRVYLDLIGLPPSPAEVDAFVNDASADAYEKIVDRLLANPHYGERMAVYWLDLVRYGDTNGLHGDTGRATSAYRDYVISAFNENKRYDQFTTEQLAGDLLPNATLQQKIASGYNRLLETSEEGGAQPKEYIAKYAADRVRNVSVVWMGATLGCAECHNHKFDPYTQRDFYAMEAFFADVRDNAVGKRERVAEMAIPDDKLLAVLKPTDEKIAALKKQLETTTPDLAAAQAAWEKRATAEVKWTPLEASEIKATSGAAMVKLPDQSVIVGGAVPKTDTYTFKATSPMENVTAIRLEVLPDISNPANGPGRAFNGNFVLSAFTVLATPAGKVSPISQVELQHASADFSQELWPVTDLIDPGAKKRAGWAVQPEFGKRHFAYFEVMGREIGKGSQLKFELAHNDGANPGHVIGRFRLSVTDAAQPVLVTVLPENIKPILSQTEQRSDEQKKIVADYYRSIAPELDIARAQLAEAQTKREELLKDVRRCEVTEAGPPRTIRVLARGNWLDESGEIMTPAVPHFLGEIQTKEARATRLDLAKWLVASDNPMTSRVYVNRLWKLFFGIGISKSVDDLGTQGERPMHPELLDWLATEFVRSGWDIKHMVRLMVTSASYRESSAGSKELQEKDPYNRLLARQSIFRLDAEFVRDNALAISGLISLDIAGESVKPPQPEGYWDFLNFPKRPYDADHGPKGHRRGLYTWWQRSFLHPSLLAFDASPREECVAERARSNTPMQALDLLNDPIFVEAARAFAQRIVTEGGSTPGDRLTFAYRLALARSPSTAERDVLTHLLEKHLHDYQADPKAAEALVSVGDYAPPKEMDRPTLAAWTSVARTIINLHETINRF